MSRQFSNVYGDEAWAEAYAGLEFPGTYHLAFRDLPGLLARHVRRGAALDFGCGAGRSSRFLQELGFDVVGIDISEAMLAHARERDPGGRLPTRGRRPRRASSAHLQPHPAGDIDSDYEGTPLGVSLPASTTRSRVHRRDQCIRTEISS